MLLAKQGKGLLLGVGGACAAVLLTATIVTTGDVRIQMAGLDVKMSTQSDSGFRVDINGAECPGAGCPAFAINWKASRHLFS